MKRFFMLLLAFLPLAAQAEERILSFHSDIRVFADGMIEVTETIEVRAEGQQIRRGIYRDFPVDYQDRLGNDYRVTLEPLGVLRNGAREAYHTVRSGRDVRTYFGSKNRFLEHGVHTYTFRYRVNRMLGFFEQHDELYYNVTGHEWAFPMDKASATVRLQFDAPRDSILVEGYTGRYGSKAQDYGRYLDDSGDIHFQANAVLPPAHGLTIVVGWPKGYVDEPTRLDRIGWLLKDNRNLLAALAGLLLLLAYYIPIWLQHGKDPAEGVIVTRYEPPTGFSPASLRYIKQMHYDNKVMTSAIVNLAVKGYLSIENDDGAHRIHRSQPSGALAALAPGEKELVEALFAEGDSVTLENTNHEVLGEARSAHRASLKQDYKQHYFRTNGWLNLPAVLIVILAAAIALNVGRGPTLPVIAMIVLSSLTMVFFAIIMKRPTLRGRKLLDEMMGFADYLEIAEKDELNLRNPPEKTPQLFEALLPYALALGVEHAWSEKFAALLASISNPDGSAYSPSWYNGTWDASNLSNATNSLSSGLNSAVSSSVTPPGSSSGGGGGGSSGGGGGGGGGGGW
ncbi:MAG: DUF2207 domain-containing protein [Gammaproteobacteria bacterium]|nr:DUF2207 domain-containing protein [Gammaproteobacteria bacterium]